MIKINRSSIDYPTEVFQKVKPSEQKLEEYYKVPLSDRVQKRFEYDHAFFKNIKKHLRNLFHQKCAYCESLIITNDGDIDRFRPKSGAISFDGKSTPDHYWWLTYDWENLYLVCEKCNFNKGNKFPVSNERGPMNSSVSKLRSIESCLLLDPCFDNPDEYLVFDDNGWVSSNSQIGQTTISLLDLNRDELVRARLNDIQTTLLKLKSNFKPETAQFEEFIELLDDNQPYSAARRQVFYRWITEKSDVFSSISTDYRATLLNYLSSISKYFSGTDIASISAKFINEQHDRHSLSIEDPDNIDVIFGKTQYITKIEIRNFRNIENLTINFPDPKEGPPPWLVILGENGMGKSSILKAIAITLMSETKRTRLNLSAKEYLRYGQEDGFVKVYVSGIDDPLTLILTKDRIKFQTTDTKLQTLFFSYGGTRLLPRKSDKHLPNDKFSRVDNLFDPFQPLIDASTWMLELDDDKFGWCARAIKDVLTSDDEKILMRTPNDNPKEIVLVSKELGSNDNLNILSDGYQSIIGLISDIFFIMLQHFDEIRDSEGIVLIDEIDVHLHPRWKVEIVNLLRKVFPRTQSIFTTHDPLCLLGANPGEIHVLRRNLETNQIEVLRHDIPPGTTADQILTGFWFGLRSTLDKGTLVLLDKHRSLLRAQTEEDNPERIEIEQELRRRLGVFNDTSIDRVAQDIASEFISAEVKNLSPKQRDEMKSNIRLKLNQIFKNKEKE